MDAIKDFLNDPLVAPIYGLLVLTLLDFLLGIWRSVQQGAFDWQKLPQVLDTVVLQKVIPLIALGAAAFLVTDPTAKTALQVAYIGGATAALAAEVAAMVTKLRGNYVATRKE